MSIRCVGSSGVGDTHLSGYTAIIIQTGRQVVVDLRVPRLRLIIVDQRLSFPGEETGVVLICGGLDLPDTIGVLDDMKWMLLKRLFGTQGKCLLSQNFSSQTAAGAFKFVRCIRLV